MAREYVLQPFRPVVDFQIDYAKELNEQQRLVVTAAPGPALVIAGAGAGKTRTLIYRVAFLLEQGVPAERILLLTFTNKAAREMMRRVAALLGSDLAALWGGTFHSMGHRILRRHADRVGYRKGFTILDREDARDLLKACLGDADIDANNSRFPKVDVLADILSLAVNTCQFIPEVVGQHYNYFASLSRQIEDLGRQYSDRKRAANVMDFDDLQVLWLRLLEQDVEVRELYQRRFQFILVDEYQDTNRIQGAIVDLLAARNQNLMVVGDDSQSIYSWRGADFRNILEFPKRYPNATVYKIETNYRSTPEILTVANAAIQANVRQFAKELAPVRRSGIKPVRVACGDAYQQAAFVAQRMLELREEGVNLNEMAVLYRSHFHALELQMELTLRNIPFTITSGVRFFEQAHIKDVTSYLKLVCNPRDELAFKRIVQLLPGIGAKGADKLWKCFETSGVETPEGLAVRLQSCRENVPKKSTTAWAELAIAISQLEEEDLRKSPSAMIRVVLEAGYEEYLQETYTNYASRAEDIERLADFAVQFEDTTEFLAQLALLSSLEAEDEKPTTNDSERVRLSTIHQAKGLEFDVVFVIMLCERLFPSARSLENPDAEEEERRLFYVAVTRARNELYLSYALSRTTQAMGEVGQLPSRFLNEIPASLLDEWNLRPEGAYY